MESALKRSVYNVGFIGEGKHQVSEKGEYTYKYKVWSSMMQRAYSQSFKNRHPTYEKCKVSHEWHNFQLFGDWFDENYYEIEENKSVLDKDILIKNNKLYSSENTLFVPDFINKLFPSNKARRGNYPIGVSFNKKCQMFQVRCNNSLKGKKKYVHLGSYNCPMEAFEVYKEYKENLIKEVANKYKSNIPIKLYDALLAYKIEVND